jgi:ABC-type Fe3+-siderophore transport system permease subunit
LALGDEEAGQLGVGVERATWTIVIAASLVGGRRRHRIIDSSG